MEDKPYNLRRRGHDYYGPFIYHIILKKKNGAPDFGKIVGNSAISPGKPGSARCNYSKMGYAIYHSLMDFENKFKEFQKEQYSIMPNHVHIILRKKEKTEIHLEQYIEILKSMVAERYQKERMPFLSAEEIFTERFTDKLLYNKIDLQKWVEYVRHNPHRRAMIMQHPEFFTRKRGIIIDGKSYEAYGNLFLLKNPDKYSVRIRRFYTPDQINQTKQLALSHSMEGSVLVSPFISEKEREIRDEALNMGGKIILIQHKEFGQRFKPGGYYFELCSKGMLLLISLGMPKGTPLSREICREMNELAAKLSRE